MYQTASSGAGDATTVERLVIIEKKGSLELCFEACASHSLEAMANALVDAFDLDSGHMWHFTIEMDEDDGQPVFFEDERQSGTLQGLRLAQGAPFGFIYDYGQSTEMVLKLERVFPGPPLPAPRLEADALPSTRINKKRPLSNEGEEDTAANPTQMDAVFPSLAKALRKGGGCRLDVGRGCCSEGFWWAAVWNSGDGMTCRSVEAHTPFADIDEAFRCFDDALTERQNKAGTIGLAPCALVYPSNMVMPPVDPNPMGGFGGSSHIMGLSGGPGPTPPAMEFNFQLPRAWAANASASALSLAAAFPQIHSKLSSDRSGWWFQVESGRMQAFKGKAKRGNAKKAHCTTRQYSSLQAAFEEMEGLLTA